MIKRRRHDGARVGRDGLSQLLDQLQEALAVKGELSAPTGVCGGGVRHGGELGTREVEAVHGDEGGDGSVDGRRGAG